MPLQCPSEDGFTDFGFGFKRDLYSESGDFHSLERRGPARDFNSKTGIRTFRSHAYPSRAQFIKDAIKKAIPLFWYSVSDVCEENEVTQNDGRLVTPIPAKMDTEHPLDVSNHLGLR